ncbi:unnamed protein product [Orchesella dallaii]|uniref:Uncharacterized protein n=1 Tax=Orchesella dallaii TaxID=48710 RepID=A0ABP1PI26_9HEXA
MKASFLFFIFAVVIAVAIANPHHQGDSNDGVSGGRVRRGGVCSSCKGKGGGNPGPSSSGRGIAPTPHNGGIGDSPAPSKKLVEV